MSVKETRNILSSQRVDVPDLRAMEAGVIFDFQSLIKQFVDSTPYILQGFRIPVTGINGPASSLQMVVSGGVVWIPNSTSGPFLRVEPGTANEVLSTTNSKVVGAFAANQDNFVGVRFKRATDPATADLVTFWDVDAKVEFTKTVPRGLVLNYEFVISQTDFGDTAPIAVVTTNLSNNVTQIKNAQQKLTRLGRGGTNPQISYSEVLSPAIENSLVATSPSDPDPFAGGDLEIKTFKQWMDVVMTRIKQLAGGSYWYLNGSSILPDVNLSDLFFDAAGSVITGVGTLAHSNVTPGLLSWTSDMYIKSTIGPLTFTISQGSVAVADNSVAYVNLVRNNDFQPTATYTFVNGSATVTSTLPVSGIVAGDWIKFESHDIRKWAKVQSVSGSTVTLTAVYQGASAIGKALKCTGTYTMQVATENSVPASANVYWIGKRNDNAVPDSTIDTPANGGATRSANVSTITTIASHGLVVGQSVSISGVNIATFNGTFQVLSTPTANTFTVDNPGTNVVSGVAGGGTVTPVAKIYLRYIGELEQGEERQIDDNTIDNIMTFIGSPSESAKIPPYSIVPNGASPYQFPNPNPDLTEAISLINGNVNDIYTTVLQPVYDEPVKIVASGATPPNSLVGPVLAGTNITMPLHSRNGNTVQNYIVGRGQLNVYLNGQFLQVNDTGGYSEVGTSGNPSNVIQIDQDLEVGDVLTIRIDSFGGPGSGAGSAPDDDFVTLPTSTTPDNADFVLIYDVSVPGYRKQTRSTFLTGIVPSSNVDEYNSNVTLNVSANDVVLIDATGGAVTVSLPAASTAEGKIFHIKKIDSSGNSVIIDANLSETIDGNLTETLTVQYQSRTITSDGTRWWIL